MTYSEKLKDPRWQKKRLEIFNRDGWLCQQCRLGVETLHVHHRYYLPKTEPWDYPDKVLVTLCESCHKNEEEERREAVESIFIALCNKGFLFGEIISIASIIESADSFSIPVSEVKALLEHFLHDKVFQRKAIEIINGQNENFIPIKSQ